MRVAPAVLSVLIICLHSARADEPPSFCGQTVDGWLEILGDKTTGPDDRETAIWALGCLGPNATDAVPDLIDEVRRGPLKGAAADALVEIGAGEEVTIPFWMEQFHKEGCAYLTGMGAIAYNGNGKDHLVKIGAPAVPALLEVMQGPEKSLRVCAAEALGKIGPPAKMAVPALIRAVAHPDDGPDKDILRHVAIQALGRIGPNAKAAISFLKGVMDKDDENQVESMLALTRIGEPPVEKLMDMLRAGDSYAATELAWLGPEAHNASPALRELLSDERMSVRVSAAVALASIDPSAVEAIPVLIEALKLVGDEETDTRDVPDALAKFGPKAGAAIPVLIDRCKEELAEGGGYYVRDLLMTLVQIDPGGQEALPILIESLKGKDTDAAKAAALCLGLLGSRAKAAAPALAVAMTRDFEHHVGFSEASCVDVQVNAVKALRRVDPRAAEAIPFLVATLSYRHVVIAKPENVDGFENVVQSRDDDAAAAAAEALGFYGERARAAVPALIQAMRTCEFSQNDFNVEGNWDVRQSSIRALGRIGSGASEAIPYLRGASQGNGWPSDDLLDSLAAFARLTPEGKVLAEQWLERRFGPRHSPWRVHRLENRVQLLGALGRASFESDWLTRRDLEPLNAMLDDDPRDGVEIDLYEEWFEQIARYGPAARLALPRLKEYRNHPNPWIRMWAGEALAEIVKK